MKHTILNCIGEQFAAEGQQILNTLGEVRFVEPSQAALQDHLADCTILIVRLGVHVDQAVIDAAPNLAIIATATTGLDHIDVSYAEEKGITVLSLKGETEFLTSVTSTAELACGLMIALQRRLILAVSSVMERHWDAQAFRGHSLSGQTLGVVGVGRLGSMMVRYGNAFGMTVLGFDRQPDLAVDGCEQVELNSLLERSDVVSIHLPLTEETEHYIGASAFARMRPSAVLINTARGRIVQEDDVLQALESGEIAGYATDVLDGEVQFGERAEHPLIEYARTHSNVIITPHIGGMTEESRLATDVFIAQKVQQAVANAD